MNSEFKIHTACLIRLVIAGAFLLQSVLPQHFAFALLNDCGPHTYEPCVEHENSHLVLIHEDGSARNVGTLSPSESDSSSHDRSHQVENSTPYAVLTTIAGSSVDPTFYIVMVFSNYSLPVRDRYRYQFSSADPPDKHFNLLSLRSIRLQV